MTFSKGNKTRLGMKNSEHQKEVVRDYMKNRVVSEETKRKMSIVKKGKKFFNPWVIGRKQSKETIEKRMVNMIGSKNHIWKGDNVSYRSLHRWVERWLGKPSECKECGIVANGHKIHWANISGKYKRNLDDWIRLCAKCHAMMDRERRRSR